MLSNLDNTIVIWLYSLGTSSELLRCVTLFFAQRLDWIVIIGVVIFLCIHRHPVSGVTRRTHFVLRLRELCAIGISTVSAWLVVLLMKYNIESPRPFLMLNIDPLFIHGGVDSFPSGHATFFMALAVAVGLYHRWLGWLLAGIAVLIGVSRVAAGVHYPVDVLAGFILGGFLAYGVHYVFHSLRRQGTEQK